LKGAKLVSKVVIDNMLVNPNNRPAKKVLMRIVESGDYIFVAISPSQSVTAFGQVRANSH
jgi:hypothetical protein